MEKQTSSVPAVERLFNLTAYLLASRDPVVLRNIISDVEGYVSGKDSESNRRMFIRDKNKLETMGIPVRTERITDTATGRETEGYFLVKEDFYLPAINFTPQEIEALSTLSSRVAPSGSRFLSSELKWGLMKLTGSGMPPSESGDVLIQVIREKPGSDDRIFSGLLKSVISRQRIEIQYRAGGASKTASNRTVDPYGLFLRWGSWYLVGFCHIRDGIRTFRLDRIIRLKTHSQDQSEPDFDTPEGFSLSSQIRKRAPWEFGDAEVTEAELRFHPQLFWQIKNSWGNVDSARFDDSEMTMTVSSVNNEALINWALGFADRVEIVSPQQLRDEIAEILRGIAAHA